MPKYCTWCGAPLEPGARFCGECGGRILETIMIDGSKGTQTEMSGFDIVDGRKMPADATLRMDLDSVVVPTDSEPKRFALDSQKKKRNVVLIVLGIVVAVLAIVAAVLAATYFGVFDQPEQAQPEAVTTTEESDEPSSDASSNTAETTATTELEEEPVALTNAEIYEALSAAYEKLDVYDDRIGGDGGLVEDFNSQFLAKSLESRTACKETADKVLSDLQADLDELNALETPTSSAYASQLADIVKLYEYQIGRVTALTEAWALDVTFETPSEHKDEILSTYSSGARSSEGSYLDLYDELYPEAKPTKIS